MNEKLGAEQPLKRAVSPLAVGAGGPSAADGLIVPPEFLEPKLINLARQRNVRVIVSIGGENEEADAAFRTVAASADVRWKLVRNLERFCRNNGYDGVDLNWEFPRSRDDSRNGVLLVKTLREKFLSPSGVADARELMAPGAIFQFGVPPNRIDFVNRIDGVTFAACWANRVEVQIPEPGDSTSSKTCRGAADTVKNRLGRPTCSPLRPPARGRCSRLRSQDYLQLQRGKTPEEALPGAVSSARCCRGCRAAVLTGGVHYDEFVEPSGGIMNVRTSCDPDPHDQKVAAVVAAVRERASASGPGEHFSLKKAAVSHLVPNPADPRHRDRKFDLVRLSEILEIDPTRRIAVAEPGVTFEALVRATLTHNLIPMVVPELKTITVGGAVAGLGSESSAFRHGAFHDTCLEYEIVTGCAEVIRCSAEQNAEIFEMMPGSFGTLAIITRVKFRLLPSAPFVRVDYHHFSALEPFLDAVQERARSTDVDFMDGIVHSRKDFVLCEGRFVEEAPYVNGYGWRIYYQSTRKLPRDYLRTYDYLFRYNRDNFWVSRNFGQENKLLRFACLPLALDSTRMFALARRFPFLIGSHPDVAADAVIPIERLKEFVAWYQEQFDYFPLWLLPFRFRKMYPWVSPDFIPEAGDRLYVCCGIYGFPQDGRRNYYEALEEKVFELRGLKILISRNCYDEDTFWRIYDRERYRKIKAKTDPRNLFRDIYRKTCFEPSAR